MSYRCDQCPPGGRCARCHAGRSQADARAYARRKVRAILDRCPAADPWLLDDDGIVDVIAVEVASRGRRPVRLTRRERELAGMAIFLRGGSVAIVISYLRLPVDRSLAWLRLRLLRQIRLRDGCAVDERAGARGDNRRDGGQLVHRDVQPEPGDDSAHDAEDRGGAAWVGEESRLDRGIGRFEETVHR
jgi:hypothetical protein